MPFTEDLTAFLQTGDFASAATLQGGTTVNVIFDRPSLSALNIASSNPVAMCRASDVVDADIGKTLTIGSDVFTIRDRDPMDDGAMVMLQLEAS